MAKTRIQPHNAGLVRAIALAGLAVFGYAAYQRWGLPERDRQAEGENASVAADENLLDRFEPTETVQRALRQRADAAQSRQAQTPQVDGAPPDASVGGSAPTVDPTDAQTLEHRAKGAIVGYPSVVSANAMIVAGRNVVIWGIAVPTEVVPCAKDSKQWACGPASLLALRQFLGTHQVACYDKGTDSQGRMVGRCFVAALDVGGGMVRDGWAVADVDESRTYAPQESDARFKKRGLWEGSFDRRLFTAAGAVH
jgi:endonuclease YncB( thermonuclease family)